MLRQFVKLLAEQVKELMMQDNIFDHATVSDQTGSALRVHIGKCSPQVQTDALEYLE